VRSIWTRLRRISPWVGLALVMAVAVFVRNAWICEDAYINFRSVEQVFAGRGPIWNPHERVQVFTSPLWFGLLTLVRLFTADVYLSTLLLSFSLWLACLAIVRRLVVLPRAFFLVVLALLATNGVSDFTSSGLENPLLYLLLAAFVFFFARTLALIPETTPEQGRAALLPLWFVSGLVLLTRLDQMFLVAPAVVGATWYWRRSLTWRERLKLAVVGGGPLLLWTIFSVIYYGFPFPNTAYAKLNTGLDEWALLKQGVKYFLASLGRDTLCLVGLGTFIWWTRRRCGWRLLAVGVVMQLAYVAWIGGDFMLGRFLAGPYLVAVLAMAVLGHRGWSGRRVLWIPLVLYAVLFWHTPFNSPLHHERPGLDLGVVDERGFYNEELSLWQYLACSRSGRAFPDMPWREQGEEFGRGKWVIVVGANVGIFGYAAGTDKIIIDRLALTDPLLARLPVTGTWRVGHYPRAVPDGYLAYVMREKNSHLPDRELQNLANDMALITRSPDLFSGARWRAIWRQNLPPAWQQ